MLDYAILVTLAYTGLFNWPLTKAELYKKLQSNKQYSKNIFERELKHLLTEHKIMQQNDYYFLPSSKINIKLRQKAENIALKKIRLSQKLAKHLSLCPWIHEIYITGSVAVGNCQANDDIDLMVITYNNRLWLVRLYIVFLTQILGKRRKPQDKYYRNKFCFNIFIEENCLTIPKERQNLFTAHELVQAKPLLKNAYHHQKLLAANYWIKEYLPHSVLKIDHNKKVFQLKYKLSIFNLINTLLFVCQYVYMKAKITNEYISKQAVYFHPHNKAKTVLLKFHSRKKAIGLI